VLGILGVRTSSAISTRLLGFYSLSMEIANITPASAYWGVLHWSWVPGPRRCSAFGFEETLRRQSQINRWEAIRRKRLTRRWWGSRRLELLGDQQLFKAQRFRRILHGFIFKEEKDFRPVKIRESSVVWPSIDMLLITSLIPWRGFDGSACFGYHIPILPGPMQSLRSFQFEESDVGFPTCHRTVVVVVKIRRIGPLHNDIVLCISLAKASNLLCLE